MHQKGFINIIMLIGVSVLVVVAGYFIFKPQLAKEINSFEECVLAGYSIMETYPEQCRTPDGRSFTKSIIPRDVAFGSLVTLRINEQAKLNDGLVVTLMEINDSRCKPDVVCIWAGELSSRFMLLGGNVTQFKEVRLGTATAKSAAQNGYTVTLGEATENTTTITVTKESEQVICTADAKLCPDGSYVSRTGPRCAFATCPAVPSDPAFLREGQRRGPLLVEKIYPNYITGLLYREYPVATDQGFPITMQIGDTASNGCTLTLTLIKIENKTAAFAEKTDYDRPCPICLAEGTLIDTPFGQREVQDLKVGDIVWTTDPLGKRMATPILAVAKTPVLLSHQVVHLKLMDGRELFVSPGHPTGDGRHIGELQPGDILGRSKVIYLEKTPYGKNFTYDILPDGESGLYFANGILIGSTLSFK